MFSKGSLNPLKTVYGIESKTRDRKALVEGKRASLEDFIADSREAG